ncbi:hypothetical protein AVEN_189807-1 [Araneus ventricosus]|uniref:Uncharacterized protein n=1 Tax=Araneus ventricosus TaxID=182803 RepID=A0A4Y2UMF9_ARAVE|nr:hypothetical protein AVEN_189807-1 [Araneus ventricosus]
MKSELAEPPSQARSSRIGPRPILLKHSPRPNVNAGQVEFQSKSSQPPTRAKPSVSSSIDAALRQMTSMISLLSQMMTFFMNLMMAMLSTLASSLKIQFPCAPSN